MIRARCALALCALALLATALPAQQPPPAAQVPSPMSDARRRRAASVTSSTARSNAAWFAREGRVLPLSFRTNCSAEARISSSVAGGSKFARTLMLRHMARID